MNQEISKYFAVYVLSTPPAICMPVDLYLEQSPKKIENNIRGKAISIILNHYNIVTMAYQGNLVFIAFGSNYNETMNHYIAYITHNPVYASPKYVTFPISLGIYPYDGELVDTYLARYPHSGLTRQELLYQVSKQCAMVADKKSVFVRNRYTKITDETPYHGESVENYELRIGQVINPVLLRREYQIGMTRANIFISIRSSQDIVNICKSGVQKVLTDELW